MGNGLFITGTDTGVGKTIITGCLTSLFLRSGFKVAVYKPVQCGNLLDNKKTEKKNKKIVSPDLALVQKLSGISEDFLFNDYSFKYASSPHLAAELEGESINPGIIKRNYNILLKKYDYVLIEGAGGLLVPLTRNYTIADLIKELNMPVIVVARSGLGTINHSNLTLTTLKSVHAKVIGIIFNYYRDTLIEQDNIKIINALNKVSVLGKVPFSKNFNRLANHFEKYINLNL